MKNQTRSSIILMLLLVTPGACVRTVDLGTVEVAQDVRQETAVRTASNLPQAFAVVIPPRLPGDCPPRLRDDGVGATLDLHRAMTMPVQDAGGTRYETFGDYRITPPGHYGSTTPADGLRVDCARLRAIGLVTLGAPGG
ncbi:MAG TPA: hypothetical protein VK929_00940 [Longimicrobiales bacterium]|nr:hypothetical protein [Longimicrobiales bacterium]